MGVTILVVSDSGYINRMKTLISSIHKFVPHAHIHAVLINCNEEEENIKKLHNDITVENIYELFQNKVIYTRGDHKCTDKHAFCANIRVKIITKLLKERHSDNILYLDADSIILRSLNRLLADMTKNDLIVYEPFGKPKTGVMGINNNKKMIHFFRKFNDLVNEYGIKRWFADQYSLKIMITRYAGRLFIKSLPISYIDWKFEPKSYIWVGKGTRKDKSKLYKQAENAINPEIDLSCVLIMVINNIKYEVLEKSVKSIINQLYDKWKLIIIDNEISHKKYGRIVTLDQRIKYNHNNKKGKIKTTMKSVCMYNDGKYIFNISPYYEYYGKFLQKGMRFIDKGGYDFANFKEELNFGEIKHYGVKGGMGNLSIYTRSMWLNMKGYDRKLQSQDFVQKLDFYWQLVHKKAKIGYFADPIADLIEPLVKYEEQKIDKDIIRIFMKQWGITRYKGGKCTCPYIVCNLCKHHCNDKCEIYK